MRKILTLVLFQQVIGDCCTCLFVFTNHSTSETVITHLLINWATVAMQSYNHWVPNSNLISYPFRSTYNSEAAYARSTSTTDGAKSSGKTAPLDLSAPLQDVTNTSIDAGQSLTVEPIRTHFDQLSSQSSSTPFETSWSTHTRRTQAQIPGSYSAPLSGRGCYVCRLSPTGALAAMAINCPKASDTEVMFVSTIEKTELTVQVYPANNTLTGR